MMKSILLLCLAAVAVGKILYSENFNDADWEKRWVYSDWKPEAERGKLTWTTGVHGDGKDHGVQTSTDARFYTVSAKIPTPFSNKGKKIIVQYTAKHEQNLDCGGSYLKFFPGPVDQEHLKGGEGENKYNFMFGPDWCGGGLKRIHAIVNHDGKNHLLEKNTYTTPSEPHVTHLYAFTIHPNNSYTLSIDNEPVQHGDFVSRPDYTILPEKEINDPAVSKPSDWVDEPEMDDPEDSKPSGWDEIPATIADPDAKKPDDWDNELDGEWEAPQISNPAYKGEWKPKRIANPNYKGPWVHPRIPNPAYKIPEGVAQYDEWSWVGIEIWQVKSGTIFDNILITDDQADATAAWEALKDFRDAESASLAAAKAEEAAKAAEEEAKAKAAAAAESETDKEEKKDEKEEL